ncbi:MAG: DUF3443 family protein [Leptospirillum sp.]
MIKHPQVKMFFLWILGCFFLSFSGCGGGGGATPSAGEPALGPISAHCLTAKGVGTSVDNTLPLYLGTAGDNSSSICGSAINNPCTDVTICDTSGSNCQTISNILVDTGSSGLRVFRSVLSNTTGLDQVAAPNGDPVGECEAFGNGSYGDWGPLVYAQVRLSGEPPVTLPIQLIDPTYAGQYTSTGSSASSTAACGQSFIPDTSPTNASFNGILGVGLFVHSCGTLCENSSGYGVFFSCSGSSCTSTTLGNCEQDQNPVPLLPTDNQGVLVSFPSPPSSNESAATGSLILGIETQPDNTPSTSSSVVAYGTDQSGNFETTFNGTTYSSSNGGAFIDSGSDGYFFPDSAISNSGSPDYYYEPNQQQLQGHQGLLLPAPPLISPFKPLPPKVADFRTESFRISDFTSREASTGDCPFSFWNKMSMSESTDKQALLGPDRSGPFNLFGG